MRPCSETDKHGATIRPDSYRCMDMWEISDFHVREGAHDKYGRHGLTCPDCKYGEWTSGIYGENSVCDEFFPGWARANDDIERWVNAPDKTYWWLPLDTKEKAEEQIERLKKWLARIDAARAKWGEDGSFKHQTDAVGKVIQKTLESVEKL